MAAHRRGGGINDRTGSRKREREEWDRDDSDDFGVVWVRVAGGSDVGVVGYDFEYFAVGSIDR